MGSHIRLLLLTLLFTYYRPLIELGYVYIVLPPLFRVTWNNANSISYHYTQEEMTEATNRLKAKGMKPTVNRYKGLGEMGKDTLYQTTMQPETRRLYQLKMRDESRMAELLNKFMGKDVTPRKEFILTKALDL